jgi:molybdopterin synthase sulfur carrier subunit
MIPDRGGGKVEAAPECYPLRWSSVCFTLQVFAIALGISDEALELPPNVRTVGALADLLAARHRAYSERRNHVRLARNEAFALDDEVLAEGDVVALIPPVAGG